MSDKRIFPAITTGSEHHTGLTRWLQKISAKDVPGITTRGLAAAGRIASSHR